MKKLSIYLLCAVAFYFTACEDTNEANPQPEAKTETEEASKSDANGRVAQNSAVPQEVVELAKDVYGSDTLPALTVAFTYTRGDSNINLEDEWSFYVYDTPESGCVLGEGDGRHYPGYLSTENGFAFVEAEDMCGFGTYDVDNRQGGWFDYVCGPSGFSFDYNGESVFVLVRLWCE
ncbi:hypothetical protein LVD17_15560 [Fulvivirga ulvae]|uniref:hypothetical protein n=1 Tax=Fulvivirga ulvae TaxID=2904245 RepID=UPI001F3A8E1C|nr:hypothetical protein [Fulvivirga ulvae]UII29716.1 hypothetical protein LVD17_15560 [Fulvivirga ulvae]